jgi:hypothetical protein
MAQLVRRQPFRQREEARGLEAFAGALDGFREHPVSDLL